jgi:hypothetical protein
MLTNQLLLFENLLTGEAIEAWKRLASETIHNDGNVIVCFAGRQGLGKSSLINMLLDEKLLPVGDDGKPNVSVHIEYGSSLSASIVRTSGENEEICLNDWHKADANTHDNVDHVVLTAPQGWLHGLTIVDSPGALDEVSAPYRARADAIVYLVSGSGPSEDDMAAIKVMALAGKRVWIGFSRWDIITDEKTKNSQPLPDIQTWEKQVEREVGVQIPVVPISSKGTGKFALTMFLESIVENKSIIRHERFQNDAIRLLENAFRHLLNHATDVQKIKDQLIESQSNDVEKIKTLEKLKEKLAEQIKQTTQEISRVQTENEKLRADNEQQLKTII